MRRSRVTITGLVTFFVCLPMLLVGTSADASSAGRSSLTIALILSETGQAATQDVGAAQGFEARLDLQNSKGGVNGHKLVPLVLDDQTSPSEVATAVQDAISKGAIGIVSDSALLFLADKFPQQAGFPLRAPTPMVLSGASSRSRTCSPLTSAASIPSTPQAPCRGKW